MSTSSPGAPARWAPVVPKVTPTMITPWISAAMNTVVVSRSRVGAMPSRSCSALALISLSVGLLQFRCDAAVKCFNHHGSDIENKLLFEFTSYFLTRGFYLGHVAADADDTVEQY